MRSKVSAALVGAVTIGGLLTGAPTALADSCTNYADGSWMCSAYPGSGGQISLILRMPTHTGADYRMVGWDNLHRNVHLDRARDGGGWDGPFGGGQGWTKELFRGGKAWRACVNVGNGAYHCTSFR